MIIDLHKGQGGGGQGGDGARKLISGNEQSLMDANKALHVKTINGQSLAGQGNIDIEGGSGDYSVVETLPEITKEGEMAYLVKDMTHEEPVTGVEGNFYQFGETGEGEYHIIQYGDADMRIYRNGDGTIYRLTSRGQEIPFSLDRTWYKLSKSFTNRKDAFYMFDADQNFWFYTYPGEEFADNNFGGATYAAGETCDYVDTVVDYVKGQYIVKNEEKGLYTPNVKERDIINDVAISFPESYASTFTAEELMLGFEWWGVHPDLYIGANAAYARFSVPQLGIDSNVNVGETKEFVLENEHNVVTISLQRSVSGIYTLTLHCERGIQIEDEVGRADVTLPVLDWEKYNFPAKVLVYDDKEGADHSDIVKALAPVFEALKQGGPSAVQAMPRDYCIIFKGIPFYGPHSEGDEDHITMYTSTVVYDEIDGFCSRKLYVFENGNCQINNGWSYPNVSKPVYVTKDGIEGMDDTVKITLSNMLGFEWNENALINCQVDWGDGVRGFHIRPKQYDEITRIGVWVDDWQNGDFIINNDYWNRKRVDWAIDADRKISFYMENDEATGTITIYVRFYGLGDSYKLLHSNTLLQEAIDAGTIDVTIETNQELPTQYTELSYVNKDRGQSPVILPNKPTFYLTANEEWTGLVNDGQLKGLINYIKNNGAHSVKDIDVKVLFAGNTVYSLNELYADVEDIYLSLNYGQYLTEIRVDYDGNTTSFEDKSMVTSDGSIDKIIKLTQEEYDALENKDDFTFYIIVS